MRGLDNLRVLGEAEVVVGAHVEDGWLFADSDRGALGGADHPFRFVGAGLTNFVDGGCYILPYLIIHLFTIFFLVKASRV